MSANETAAAQHADRRRRRVRRWVILATLPVTLAAVLLLGKLLSMYAFAHQAISAYTVGDTAASEAAARGQGVLNLFDPFAASYNRGTALAAEERLDEARAELEEALPLAEGLRACAVHVNLALVVERLGDAARDAGDGVGATALYGEALRVTAHTPQECESPAADAQSPDPERSLSDALEGLRERLPEKQRDGGQPPPPDPPDGEGPPPPDQDKLDQLQDRLTQGAREREQHRQGDGDGGGGTEKPW